MSESMRAIMARALCEEAGYDPDGLEPGDDPYMNNQPVDDGRNAKGYICHFNWRRYVRKADSVLAAIEAAGMVVVPREASAAMLEAGERVGFGHDPASYYAAMITTAQDGEER